ncbi:hypothetical protein [Roseovarius sp. MBR-6]|jgi:hypothetical protein|uniref:hypothetical protein n=1 Tax=Roseovarius sp. MBR-6 TaxID=3156459 RepID=UPI003399AF6A
MDVLLLVHDVSMQISPVVRRGGNRLLTLGCYATVATWTLAAMVIATLAQFGRGAPDLNQVAAHRRQLRCGMPSFTAKNTRLLVEDHISERRHPIRRQGSRAVVAVRRGLFMRLLPASATLTERANR